MEPRERAEVTLAIVDQFTATLRQLLMRQTTDDAEQLEIAGACLALMLRRMYQQRGQVWLEAILQSVLQP